MKFYFFLPKSLQKTIDVLYIINFFTPQTPSKNQIFHRKKWIFFAKIFPKLQLSPTKSGVFARCYEAKAKEDLPENHARTLRQPQMAQRIFQVCEDEGGRHRWFGSGIFDGGVSQKMVFRALKLKFL